MKQTINLCQLQKANRPKLNFDVCFGGCAVLVVLLMGFNIWLHMNHKSLKDKRDQVVIKYASTKQTYTKLVKRIEHTRNKQDLTKELDAANAQLIIAKNKMAFISELFPSQRAFSKLYQALLRNSGPIAELASLEIENKGKMLNLKGHSAEASKVPILIEAYNDDPILHGLQFSIIQIRKANEQFWFYIGNP